MLNELLMPALNNHCQSSPNEKIADNVGISAIRMQKINQIFSKQIAY